MSGVLPVKAQCLPFSRIPHTSRLFLDFLAGSEATRPFYPRTPDFSNWLKDEASLIGYDDSRRSRVSDVLERQNRAFGSGQKTLDNIARLRKGAVAAVTGQQVGLFGGPLFSIFKALTAVKLAETATLSGVECVPVFWLATEDHDLAEVNHVELPGAEGKLERFSADSHSVEDAPVGSVVFGDEIQSVVKAATDLLGDSEASTYLRDAYRAGENMGSAFGKLFARVFGEWGVILLDASDAELHQIAAPLFVRAIEQSTELDEKLLARGKELESAGYHQQVKVTTSSTPLFMYRNGARIPVRRKAGNDGQNFVVGEEVFSRAELVEHARKKPEDFSPNVLLRPIVQDYLLPTLVYTGGSAEVAYFAQLGVVYEALAGRLTPILPRFSATILEPKMTRLLEKYDIEVPALFQGPEVLREQLAQRTLPADLLEVFATAQASLDESLAAIEQSLERLDKTLVEAGQRSGSKMKHQLEELRARAGRSAALRNDLISRHAEQLSEALYPNKVLQEREVGGAYFLSRYGKELLHDLYSTMHTDCHDHQVITLE